MAEREYKAPNNEQLASFLVIHAKHNLGFPFDVDPYFLEGMLDRSEELRVRGLMIHRKFVNDLNDMLAKMEKGELQCQHIRPNNKKCPNYNEPGSFYCGLHRWEEEDEGATVPE